MTCDEFKAWRSRMDVTQQKAAELLGVSAATIGNYEKGMRREDGRPVSVPLAVEMACASLERKRALHALIDERLPSNSRGEITAARLREVLKEIVDRL